VPHRSRRLSACAAVLVLSSISCDLFTGPDVPDLPPIAVRWKFSQAGTGDAVYADSNLVVFYPWSEPGVWALDAQTGVVRWRANLDIPPEVTWRSLPGHIPVASGQVLVVPGWDLYGLDRGTGEVLWSLRNDDFAGVYVTLGDASVYSAGIGRVYRVDPATGTVLWQAQLGEWSDSVVERPYAPVYHDGVVYVVTRVLGVRATVPLGERIGHVVALDASNGTVLWRFPIPEAYPYNGGALSRGAVAGEMFVVGAENGRVYGLDRATGQQRWVHQGSQPYEAGVVIVGDVAITGNLDGVVEALDAATGTLRWRSRTNLASIMKRIEAGLGGALVARGRLEAYDASGLRWSHGGGSRGPSYLSGAAALDRSVYIGDERAIYALTIRR
jgi:outer membrane protein assembly factor BamB